MEINMLYFSHMSYYEIYVLNLRRENNNNYKIKR